MSDLLEARGMDTDPKLARVWALAEPVASESGLELVDVEHRREGQGMVLRLVLDKPEGVSLDELAEVSRQVADLLDVHDDALPGSYTLEVSSPGVNRPLARPAHFAAFVGKRVHVRTRRPQGERHTFRGALLAVEGDGIEIRTDDGATHAITFDNVARANYQHEFPVPAKPGRARRGHARRRTG